VFVVPTDEEIVIARAMQPLLDNIYAA